MPENKNPQSHSTLQPGAQKTVPLEMKETDIVQVPEDQGLGTRKDKIESSILPGTSEAEISQAMVEAQKEAAEKFPNNPLEQRAYFGQWMARYFARVGNVQIARDVAGANAKAAAQLRSDIPEHLKQSINEVLKTLFVNGVMTDLDTWKSYQKRFEGIQDDVIKRAMNTAMQPYEMMGTLSSLGVMFGGIAQMAGTAFDKPEWAAWGKSTITDSIKMAEFAASQQMAMKDSMTNQIKRVPKDWDPQSNYAKQGSDVLRDAIRLYLNGEMDGAVLRNVIMNSVSGGANSPQARGNYGPIGALSGATRDQVFAAMITQESNGNPAARSNKGAMGLGQIMPETAKEIAKEMGITFNQATYDKDPGLQLKMSRHYFDKLASKYNDNMVLTLAAYNSGPGAVDDFMNGTNLSKNSAGGRTNPTGIRLGDPRKGQTTDVAFAENYQYGETRIYIGKIAANVANGVGYGIVAKANDKSKTLAAAAAPAAAPTAAAPTIPAKKVSAVDDRHNKYTPAANEAFAYAQPRPTAPDTLTPAQRAALAMVADDPTAREERKQTVAVNLPQFNFDKQA